MFIVAGPPGAGKTTQCQLLAKKYGFIWIATGAILRATVSPGLLKEMSTGKLMPDEVVQKTMKAEFDKHQDHHDKLLLDGFPRDFHQTRWTMEEYGAEIQGLVIIEISEKEMMERLLERGRPDDNPKSIKKRVKIFEEETSSVMSYLEQHGIPEIRINGERPIEVVNLDIARSLGVDV